jgi:hypothetical protein
VFWLIPVLVGEKYKYIYTYICVCVCMYTYIYIYINIYTHTFRTGKYAVTDKTNK